MSDAPAIRTLLSGIPSATDDGERRPERGGAVFENLYEHFRRKRD